MKKTKLQELREARQLSVFELSVLSRVSGSLIYRYEGGSVAPRLDNARALADALGVTIDELFPAEVEATA